LIIRSGGADRPFRHDLHSNEASSFQIGVSRGRRMGASVGSVSLVTLYVAVRLLLRY
jgi:hypothetical protein